MTRRLLCLALLFPALAAAAPVLKTVPLHHRMADEVVTIIRPLAPKGVSIVAAGDQVLLRGEQEQIAPLVEAIGKIDVAQKALLVTVREGGAAERESRGVVARGTAREPDVRVYGTEDRDRPASTRQVRTLEGQWARVATGTAVPVIQQSTIITPQGAATQQGTQYKDVESGFEIRPRLAGKNVIVDVRAFHGNLSREGGGTVESSSIESTVQGPLGQWLDVGGTVEEQRRDEQGTVYSTRSREQRLGHIQIKIEIAP